MRGGGADYNRSRRDRTAGIICSLPRHNPQNAVADSLKRTHYGPLYPHPVTNMLDPGAYSNTDICLPHRIIWIIFSALVVPVHILNYMRQIVSRKNGAIIILLSGIVFAWFITKGDDRADDSLSVSVASTLDKNISFTRETGASSDPPKNLTEEAIQGYLTELVKKNPDGPQNNTLVFPSQDILESAIQQATNAGISFHPITKDDIKISDAVGEEAERSYIAAIQNAGKENSKKINANEMYALYSFFSENNAAPLISHINGLQSFVLSLIETPTPVSMEEFHIKLINLQIKKIAIMENFLELENDPMKTMVALREYEKLPEEEKALAEMIAQKL